MRNECGQSDQSTDQLEQCKGGRVRVESRVKSAVFCQRRDGLGPGGCSFPALGGAAPVVVVTRSHGCQGTHAQATEAHASEDDRTGEGDSGGREGSVGHWTLRSGKVNAGADSRREICS